MPEVVRLIDNDKVVIAWLTKVVRSLNHLFQTAIGDKVAVFVLYAKVCKSIFPVAFDCRREYDEDAGIVAVGGDEALGNHSGHHGLAQTHHVGDEASAVLHHNVVALHHSVALVGQVVVARGQHGDEVVLHLVAEVVDEHTHIELVGRGLLFLWGKVGASQHPLHVGNGYGLCVGPQALELTLAVGHVVIVLHRHVELVARRLSGAQPLVADVAAAHHYPSVAVLAMMLW